jgi:hypothetical protein
LVGDLPLAAPRFELFPVFWFRCPFIGFFSWSWYARCWNRAACPASDFSGGDLFPFSLVQFVFFTYF